MRRILCLAVLLVLFGAAGARAQSISVTAPSGGANGVASANDFATRVIQDPWDMSQRTDVGWWLNSVDTPTPGFFSTSFSGGVFTGTVAADPNLWLLETNLPNLPAIGKNGSTFPIDANTYRLFAIRMRVSEPGYFWFHWSTNTMYEPPGLQTSGYVLTSPGWRIYIVDLPTLGLLVGSDPWTGTKRSLRFDPAPDNATPGSTIQIDWARLVDNQPSLLRTITWNNTGGAVDIYLDNDNSPTNDPNQTLGLLASNVTGGSYQFNVGALEPGNYFVAMRRSGTNDAFSYSSGFYQVNAPATLTITAPSEEGSDDDFATVHLNDPWDMTAASDIDKVMNVVNNGIATVPGAVTEADTPLGDMTAFVGTSTLGEYSPAPCASFAKPVVYPLHSLARGGIQHIDPTKYRILTAELGLPNKPRDLCGGSIVRVVWQVSGQSQETYSWGIALNSRAGANVLNKINLDMASLPIDPASPSQAGWVPGSGPFPGITSFRIDPHEFYNPTLFYIKRVKLAALETADAGYTVRWTASRTGGTVRVYYDTDKDPSIKTFIGSTSAASINGSLAWNTSGLPQGQEYFVYVEFDDGLNVNGAYSKWPVKIDHSGSSTARIVLNHTTLNFGVTAQTLKTGPQLLRLTTVNGSPCWNAIPDLNFMTVTPSSGCGSATLTVSLANQGYSGYMDLSGYIRVTSSGAINSPQLVQTVVRIRPTSTPPTGLIDTPANGATVRGSVAVTGWAIDDIGVARVTVCRDPVAGEAGGHPACGPNQIYLGDAVSIDDARPDLEAYSPTAPLNYRAGWGFLVLTNTLPNQGNGAFNVFVYAFDVEGRAASLGFRTIYGQNSTAVEPFGTIDTPGQGETIGGSNYANFGWVLSRVYRADPPGGGSVTVFIDGVAVGTPCCWNQRSDLNALFPGYPGLSTALGVLGFDTYTFGNGLHTIVWVVTDNAGNTTGVGSRFFSIFNAGAASTVASAMRPLGADVGRSVEELGAPVASGSVAVREGFRLRGSMQTVASVNGLRRVWATERDRLEIRLSDPTRARRVDEYAAYLLVNGRLRELPVGSAFDPARGAFYWQPGLGYVGDYDLLFVRRGTDGTKERIPVRVTLQPRPTVRMASVSGDVWSRIEFAR